MPLTIDDRALAHIEIVIFAKLRRRESLSFSIEMSPDAGRNALWISPSSTLRFEYEAPMPEINRRWLQELIESANSSAGLRLIPEPELPASR